MPGLPLWGNASAQRAPEARYDEPALPHRRRLRRKSMEERDDRYVLARGEEGARRLRVVNRVHGPDTEALLRRAGLVPGMRVADVGCGIGMVSAWIAAQVGAEGEAVGI